MALEPDIAGFSRLITALDPWLNRVVIVGGWATGCTTCIPPRRRSTSRHS